MQYQQVTQLKFYYQSQTTELILLPIITTIMEDKAIETITYINSVGKKKQSIERIKTHLLQITKLIGRHVKQRSRGTG